MIEKRISERGSTRYLRTDSAFADLLSQDFGISAFAAHALVGVPKKQAIHVAAWAHSNIADADDRSDAVRAWARKRKVGKFDPRLHDDEPPTYGGRELEGV